VENVTESAKTKIEFHPQSPRTTIQLIDYQCGECGENKKLNTVIMKNKIILKNHEVGSIISACSSFKELNYVLSNLVELKQAGFLLPELAIRAYSKLFILNLSLKNDQLN
jgi:hypothetical protein